MMLSRNLRTATGNRGSSYTAARRKRQRRQRQRGGSSRRGKREPDLEAMLDARDYSGAIAVLEFYRREGKKHPKFDLLPWLGYCYFHLGDYDKATKIYTELLQKENRKRGSRNWLYLACCRFFLGEYRDAQDSAQKGPDCPLRNRVLFHCADRLHDEYKVVRFHKKLDEDDPGDRLCLAAMHYMRTHVREATEIYKKMLVEETSYHAVNVYVALCYYKMDFYDIALEVLNAYLAKYPDSPIAVNLKACGHCKLFHGRAAERELRPIIDLRLSSYSVENLLIKHNRVVFRGGENALRTLPRLVDIIPEARLNLVIYHLRKEDYEEAYRLIKDLEPIRAREFILKGVACLVVGRRKGSRELLNEAKKYFRVVGTSKSECDTIPGRRCMAACYFIVRNFEDVKVYLKSIKSFFARRRLQLELRPRHGRRGQLQGRRGPAHDDPEREAAQGARVHQLAGALLHHERQAQLRVGAVPQDGDLAGLGQPAAAHRQRLLQDRLCRLLRRSSAVDVRRPAGGHHLSVAARRARARRGRPAARDDVVGIRLLERDVVERAEADRQAGRQRRGQGSRRGGQAHGAKLCGKLAPQQELMRRRRELRLYVRVVAHGREQREADGVRLLALLRERGEALHDDPALVACSCNERVDIGRLLTLFAVAGLSKNDKTSIPLSPNTPNTPNLRSVSA